MLLEQGLDPTLCDVQGNHPLMFACISNRIENVKYWLKRFKRSDLKLRNRLNGATPLHAYVLSFLVPNASTLISKNRISLQ